MGARFRFGARAIRRVNSERTWLTGATTSSIGWRLARRSSSTLSRSPGSATATRSRPPSKRYGTAPARSSTRTGISAAASASISTEVRSTSSRPCASASSAALRRRPLLATSPLLAENRSDTGAQLLWTERLLDVVRRPGLHPARNVAFLDAGGEEDDGHLGGRRMGAETPRHLATVELRHRDVENGKVWKLAEREVERLLSVGGAQNAVAAALEPQDDQTLDVRIVVGDEHRLLDVWENGHELTIGP